MIEISCQKMVWKLVQANINILCAINIEDWVYDEILKYNLSLKKTNQFLGARSESMTSIHPVAIGSSRNIKKSHFIYQREVYRFIDD